MSAPSRPDTRARERIAASVLLVAVLIAGLIVAISNQLGGFGGDGLRDGEVRTTAADPQAGAALHVDPRLSIEIPGGALSGAGTMELRRHDGSAPDMDVGFASAGQRYELTLSGSTLTGAATVQLPVTGPPAEGFVPLAAYWDVASQHWQPLESQYDRELRLVRFTTQHFSWFTLIQFDAQWLSSLVRGAIDGLLPMELLGAPPAECQNSAAALARAKLSASSVRGEYSDSVLSCLDEDLSGDLVLRTVNNRRFALSVHGMTGLERIADERPALPTMKNVGPFLLERYGYQVDTVVAKDGSADFRVVDASAGGELYFENSGFALAVEVLEAGIQLAFAVERATFKGATTTTAAQLLEKANCFAEAVNELTVPLDDPAVLGKAVVSSLRGTVECFGEVWMLRADLGRFFVVAAVAAITATVVALASAALGEIQYWVDFVSGRLQHFLTVEPIAAPVTGPAPAPGPSLPADPVPGAGARPDPKKDVRVDPGPRGGPDPSAPSAEIVLQRIFTADANGSEVGSPRCGEQELQLVATVDNRSSAAVTAVADVGVKDLTLSLYHHLTTFDVSLPAGVSEVWSVWRPEHWISGPMRHEFGLSWPDGTVSDAEDFTITFDQACAQPLGPTTPPPAPPAHREVALSESSGPPGSSVEAWDSGFQPGTDVEITQTGLGVSGEVTAVRVDGNGAFETTIVISRNATPGADVTVHFRQDPDIDETFVFAIPPPEPEAAPPAEVAPPDEPEPGPEPPPAEEAPVEPPPSSSVADPPGEDGPEEDAPPGGDESAPSDPDPDSDSDSDSDEDD